MEVLLNCNIKQNTSAFTLRFNLKFYPFFAYKAFTLHLHCVFKCLGSLLIIVYREDEVWTSPVRIYQLSYQFYSLVIRPTILWEEFPRNACRFNIIILVSGLSLLNDALLMTFKIDISSWEVCLTWVDAFPEDFEDMPL